MTDEIPLSYSRKSSLTPFGRVASLTMCFRCNSPMLCHKRKYCKPCYKIHKEQGLVKCRTCHMFLPKCSRHGLSTNYCLYCNDDFYNVEQNGLAISPWSRCVKCSRDANWFALLCVAFYWFVYMIGCKVYEWYRIKKNTFVQ
jgi:hypothetical protein